MKKASLVLWMTMLMLLLALALPLSAQDNSCDPSIFGEVDDLLAQVEEALDNGNITTANVILSGIRTTIAPCIGNAGEDNTTESQPTTGDIQPVSSNADWTPVIREFDGVEMVLVPPGCFDMGSTTGEDNEQPVHEQCFDEPFWIDRHEVYNAQYIRVSAQWANDHLPLTGMTWFEALDFCELRGTRLPTEAEWEYAARGPDGLQYPWGNDFIDTNVAYNANASRTSDVRNHPEGASWVGALDMSGNVTEWTNTLYMDYPYNADDGREIFTSDSPSSQRVLRGGSFTGYGHYIATTYRYDLRPSVIYDNGGFRCTRDYDG